MLASRLDLVCRPKGLPTLGLTGVSLSQRVGGMHARTHLAQCLSVSSSLGCAMTFARLPNCQIYELFTCLGPDYYHLRGSCVMAREKSNDIDLLLEILKWHCTNSDLLDVKLRCVEVLGRIPLRCSCCNVRARTRQIYRYNRGFSDGYREGVLYLCSHCALKEARLFLTGNVGGLFLPGRARQQRTGFAPC